ncbi:MAG: cytidylyltransferase domain-containing protein [Alkalispirochaetaceae bacterium]
MRDVAVGLQVRLDSSRLPRKALLPLEGKLVIEHAMDALAATGIEHRYILTDEESAPVLAPLGERYGFSLLVGDPQDVLGRYARMAEVTGAPVVVRATGDNPAVSARMCLEAIKLRHASGADLAGFDQLPLGTGVEVLSAKALLRSHREAVLADEREHVTLHIYRNRDAYLVDRRPAPREARMEKGRITLDTEEDYRIIEEVYRRRYRGVPLEVEEVIGELERLLVCRC